MLRGISRHPVIWLVTPAVWWIALLLLLSSTIGAAPCPAMRPFQNAALLLGISDPWLQEGPRPLRFAGADATSLQPLFERQFGADNVFVLKDRDANTANVSFCLDALARFANPGSKVVIFISARGFASSQTDDGFVLTYDSAIDKLPRSGAKQSGNGIAIQTLGYKLAAMQAREKYLLLDLCRDPAETPNLDNLINKRLTDKRFLDAATREIVLASTGNHRSFESGGHGFYAAALLKVIQPEMGLPALFGELKEVVTKESQKKQVPYRPPPPSKAGDECLLCKLSQNWRSGPLFASLAPLIGFQDAPPTSPGTELQILNEAAREEEQGQRIFIRYGEGNHFPGDPLHQCDNPSPDFHGFRLCKEEYGAAAKNFGRAAELVGPPWQPSTAYAVGQFIVTSNGNIHVVQVAGTSGAIEPAWIPATGQTTKDGTIIWVNPGPAIGDGKRMVIESLQERARFCRAQVLLLENDWDGAVRELGPPANFHFAESHNSLGIAYLELNRYLDAEVQFESAIQQAPHWGYPRHNLALAYVEHGNYTAAENEYREAIRWTPVAVKQATSKANPCFHGRSVTISARPYLYYNLGVLLQRLNRLAEAQQQYCLAEESFQMALRLWNPSGSETEADQAKFEKLRAIAAKINLADASNSLGVLLETRRKSNEARIQFHQALSNNPELSAAAFNLARLDANQDLAKGDVEAARQRYQAVLDTPFCRGSSADLGCRAARTALGLVPK